MERFAGVGSRIGLGKTYLIAPPAKLGGCKLAAQPPRTKFLSAFLIILLIFYIIL
jgi:hypothetical protein